MSGHGAIDERIQELVEAHRDQLAELVDQAVDAELARLVAQALERRNGAAAAAPVKTPTVQTNGSRPGTKTCTSCSETKPTTDFERNRAKCRACRRREERQRAARRDPEPADPARPAVTAAELRERGGNGIPADELERWLLDEHLAELGPSGLTPTARAVEIAEALE